MAVLYKDFRWRTKTIPVTFEGDLERLIASGERYALIIGIQDYVEWPKLKTPHKDSLAVAKVLQEQYGFKIEIVDSKGTKTPLVLLDPDLVRILRWSLRRCGASSAKNELFLIYYAGHGNYLGQSKDAYWIPRNGKVDDDFSWLSANVLRSKLKQMNARSILVVSNSCFSGAMKGPGPGDLSIFDPEHRRALKKAGERRSRLYISSGALEPVLDEGCDSHSIFACAFLSGLRSMDTPIFSSGELFVKFIRPRVGGRADQDPQWDKLSGSAPDENSGEFIFARRQALDKGKSLEAKSGGPQN